MFRKQIPNIVTLCNLLCGCAALYFISNDAYPQAAFCIGLGLLADFSDGMVARALGVSNPLGVQLDSLADMVSFGVVPGYMLFSLLYENFYGTTAPEEWCIPWLAFPGFLFTAFAAYRLAKFNIDTRQSVDFVGIPTPASTMFVIGLVMVKSYMYDGNEWMFHPAFIYVITLILSFLMISEIKHFSLKFKNLSWKGNESRFIIIFVSIILLIIFRSLGICLIITLYIIMSIFGHLKSGNQEPNHSPI